VEVGLALPQYDWDGSLKWDLTVATAQRAEALGFASVWLADHLFLDPARYGQSPGQADGLDPLVGLAGVARATSRVRLGTLVLCTPLRPATIAAKALATLDRLAHGRLIVGVGAGWYEAEFDVAGIPFERPGARVQHMEDAVRTFKGMWRDDPDYPPCRPGPFERGGPPVWVGGQGDRVMEVAARYADGFNHTGWRTIDGPSRFDVFFDTCERVGRDPATIEVSAVHAIHDFHALPDELATFERLGVSTLIVSVGPLPFSVTNHDALERVASALP
jgi:alkanesulfonate monooxygenase SsuD/methylene tetrahydromethanopterin reductase-like flavin-dependent oxidoreductase (luciferase family)